MKIKYINNIDKCCNLNEKNGVVYVTFPKLETYNDELLHGFSTRLGGVSKAHLSAMNLSFARGDETDNVMENHRRFAASLGYDESRLVFSDQVHLTNFYKVTEKDCGKGITRESDIIEIDGLVTNVPDIPMITFYADCVPLLFYDPVRGVIAMAHSGWKGTVNRIGAKMVSYMGSEYGTRPEDIICAIAPSICQECYEVSVDVAEKFIQEFHADVEDYYSEKPLYYSAVDQRATFNGNVMHELIYEKDNGKYQLNLHKACELILLRAGVTREHIDITDICTCCNPELFFSHRASRGKRGNNAAVMMIKS